jgi:hypothetical protein
MSNRWTLFAAKTHRKVWMDNWFAQDLSRLLKAKAGSNGDGQGCASEEVWLTATGFTVMCCEMLG